MFGINTVTVSGTLGRDPEYKSFGDGGVANFSIAHNARKKDGASGEYVDVTHWFRVDMWGGIGKWVADNVKQGDGVVVSGQLQYQEWETESGDKRNAVRINARDVQVVRSKGDGGGSRQSSAAPASSSGPASSNAPGAGFQQPSTPPVPSTPPAPKPVDDDSIPF